jgi:hypothetical protein
MVTAAGGSICSDICRRMKATPSILMTAVYEYTPAPESADLVWNRKEAQHETQAKVTQLDTRRAALSRETRPDGT